jgi:hypothetical protein
MTIQEILTEHRIEFLESGHHHCRVGWLQLKVCPFCESDSYHLGWNLASNYASCWRCGHHPSYKLLEALGVSKGARALLDGAEPGPVQREVPGKLQLPAGLGPLQAPHRRYLRERGFAPCEIVRRWGVRGLAIAGRLSWRLFIPIYQRTVQVSWTTRAIGDVQPRYVSAGADQESFPHKRLVYGLDFCATSVVAVEGPLDAWAIGPGAGALFGTTFLAAQVLLLAKYPRRFVCLDSSPEAQVRARALVDQLAVFPGTTQNIVLDSKDPADASPRELKLLRKATGLAD